MGCVTLGRSFLTALVFLLVNGDTNNNLHIVLLWERWEESLRIHIKIWVGRCVPVILRLKARDRRFPGGAARHPHQIGELHIQPETLLQKNHGNNQGKHSVSASGSAHGCTHMQAYIHTLPNSKMISLQQCLVTECYIIHKGSSLGLSLQGAIRKLQLSKRYSPHLLWHFYLLCSFRACKMAQEWRWLPQKLTTWG